jgi:hypothetical protein
MAGFVVEPPAVRAASRATERCVDDVRGADSGAQVTAIAEALPGSASAAAATDYVQAWSARFRTWCQEAEQHATRLSEVATNYAITEENNTWRFNLPAGSVMANSSGSVRMQ